MVTCACFKDIDRGSTNVITEDIIVPRRVVHNTLGRLLLLEKKKRNWVEVSTDPLVGMVEAFPL